MADVKYEGKKALVCMVGEDIRGQNGIAAQVFNAIRHINVRMISQGASEINMSFMIEEEDADEAVRSLHAAFLQRTRPRASSMWKREGSFWLPALSFRQVSSEHACAGRRESATQFHRASRAILYRIELSANS